VVVGLAAPLSWTIVTSSTCLGTMRCDTADIVVPHAMPTIVESVTASLIALPPPAGPRPGRSPTVGGIRQLPLSSTGYAAVQQDWDLLGGRNIPRGKRLRERHPTQGGAVVRLKPVPAAH